MIRPVIDQAARVITGGFFIVYLFITGCAHLQTDNLLQSNLNNKSHVELVEVPFIPQDQYQCGPAALAMMLQAENKSVTAEALVPQVYLPKQKGSLQIEMLAAARQYNVVPYVLDKNIADLLAEVSAEHPVLVMQNLGLSWLPKWHYAVVVGYDFKTAEIILRSGIEFRHVVSMKVFERTWARSNYWAVVMLSPDKLPATAEEKRFIEAVAMLERQKVYEVSQAGYESALKKWPENQIAMMGLANSYYARQDYHNAAVVFKKLTGLYPEFADAYNNLADTLAKLQRYEEAMLAAKHAVKLGGKRHSIYLQTLSEVEQLMLTM